MFWFVLTGSMFVAGTLIAKLCNLGKKCHYTRYNEEKVFKTWDKLCLCVFESELFEILQAIFVVIGLAGLAISIFVLPLQRNYVLSEIQQYEAIRHTVNVSRELEEITEWERIKLTEDIIEANKNIARFKYYAGHPWFKLYYPEEVLGVEFIN